MTAGEGTDHDRAATRRFAQGRWRAGTVGPVLGAVVAVTALLLAPPLESARMLALAAFAALTVPLMVLEDRRRPTWVVADVDGLTTGRGGRTTATVAWQDVRRGRRATGPGRPRETHLERTDGRLVALPPSMAAGTVDRWREELGGAAALLPTHGTRTGGPLRAWEQTEGEQPRRELQPPTPLGPWLPSPEGDGYVSADADEVTVIRDGTRTVVPWTDLVAQQGRRDRWDDEQVLVRGDGTQVRLPHAFPGGRVEEWRQELGRPAGPRP